LDTGLRKYRGRLSYLPIKDVSTNPFNQEVKRSDLTIGSECGQLPSLSEPVPSNWTTIEDEFVVVYSAHQSHLSKDCLFAPTARLDDSIIHLLYIKGDVTRVDLLSFLTSLERGSHSRLPFVTLVPVKAFRLEPQTDVGYLTVDGELVDFGPLQAEVMPAAARVMS